MFSAGCYILLPIVLFSILFPHINEIIRESLTENITVEKADAIIILAGAMQIRVTAGAEVYKKGYAPFIILTNDGVSSSWSHKYQRNLNNIEWAEERLVQSGVPRSAIIKLPFMGSGTIYDALSTKNYVENARLKSLIIVTSDYHTKRSLWTFRHVFRKMDISIGIIPVHKKVNQDDVVNEIRMTLGECIKFGYYLVRFGLFRNFGSDLYGFDHRQ